MRWNEYTPGIELEDGENVLIWVPESFAKWHDVQWHKKKNKFGDFEGWGWFVPESVSHIMFIEPPEVSE